MVIPLYTLRCRRCSSHLLLLLDKRLQADNDVYRCTRCGFIFSPPLPPPPLEHNHD